VISTPWYRRSSFKSLWKTVTGLAGSALSGLMTWKDAGVAAGLAVIASSWDILFGEDSFRGEPTKVIAPPPPPPPD
jgi:hypothetical protein